METRVVFAVIGNTDCTEGRGNHFVKAYCETLATARRVGHKGYVQGGDCPVETRTLYKPDGETSWFGPVTVKSPTEQDLKLQSKLDEQTGALERARSAGLSEAEIALIRASR